MKMCICKSFLTEKESCLLAINAHLKSEILFINGNMNEEQLNNRIEETIAESMPYISMIKQQLK